MLAAGGDRLGGPASSRCTATRGWTSGKIGTRPAPITAACDKIEVQVAGPGGHTARPHLTADLVYALGKIITELPAALSRRVDPRSSLSLVWGRVSAGTAANAIPDDGMVEGTVRCLDDEAWHAAPDLLKALLESVASAYGVVADLTYLRNVPPTVNEAVPRAMLDAAAEPGARARRRRRAAAEPGRRGLRLVPGVDPRRAGPARHPGPGIGRRLRHPPADVRRRRAGHRDRGQG